MTHDESMYGTYYCPMHPTYTSDRPGNCAICQMRLVLRQAQDGAPSEATGRVEGLVKREAQGAPKDVCVLHNCPMAREGRPCPMLVVAKEGEQVTCPVCGQHVAGAKPAPSQRKILYWTDPMIPGFRADGPGKSPMGMDLVPVYEEAPGAEVAATAPEGYAPVLVSPQKQQLIGIRTAAVERKPLVRTIRASGTIAHDPELYQAQAEHLEALRARARANAQAEPAVIEQAEQLVDATTFRLRHLGLSEELIDEIGTWPGPQQSLLIARPGEPVWMYAKVYEQELPSVRVGQPVAVDVPGLPGQVFHGRVRAIDAMVDAMTRTTRVRAELENPDGALKPDMFVNATIEADLGVTTVVPREAVFETGLKQIVFVDKGRGLFEPREVVVGARTDAEVEVRSGVTEGERVVTSGNFLIDSESRLKAALQGLGASDDASAPSEGPPQHVH
jgi:hypothetical protein